MKTGDISPNFSLSPNPGVPNLVKISGKARKIVSETINRLESKTFKFSYPIDRILKLIDEIKNYGLGEESIKINGMNIPTRIIEDKNIGKETNFPGFETKTVDERVQSEYLKIFKTLNGLIGKNVKKIRKGDVKDFTTKITYLLEELRKFENGMSPLNTRSGDGIQNNIDKEIKDLISSLSGPILSIKQNLVEISDSKFFDVLNLLSNIKDEVDRVLNLFEHDRIITALSLQNLKNTTDIWSWVDKTITKLDEIINRGQGPKTNISKAILTIHSAKENISKYISEISRMASTNPELGSKDRSINAGYSRLISKYKRMI